MNISKAIKILQPHLNSSLSKIVYKYYRVPEVLVSLTSECFDLPYNIKGGAYYTMGILSEDEYFTLIPILENYEPDELEEKNAITTLHLNHYEQQVDIYLFYTLNKEKINAFKTLHEESSRFVIGSHDLINALFRQYV